MKIFEFNPETGRRGRQIDERPRVEWTGPYLQDYSGVKPAGFGPDTEVGVHTDAGRGLTDRYNTDGWICFCLGCWRVGVHDDGTPDEKWQWIILPPVGGYEVNEDE